MDTTDILLKTTFGEITLRLDRKSSPVTTENFVQYVTDGHYDGTIFHRVIDGFMIQGGGFKPDMSEKKTRAPIQLEARNGLKNKRYTTAMARTGDPNSATSQFFINVGDNDFLYYRQGNDGYAVFGEVISGQDVVDRIKKVATGRKGSHDDVPNEAVMIESASLVS